MVQGDIGVSREFQCAPETGWVAAAGGSASAGITACVTRDIRNWQDNPFVVNLHLQGDVMPDWMRNGRFVSWAPYTGKAEATYCLTRFVDQALSPHIGIIWCSQDAGTLVRAPVPDANGYGFAVTIEWQAAAPPPPPHPTIMQRLERVFDDAMAAEGRAAIAQGQAQMAEGRALASFFASKEGEHATGMAIDVLGLVCFAALFVPGIGEAELGFVAAMRAGQWALTAGRVTAGMAAIGSGLAARVDGKYLLLRYFDGPDGPSAARTWDESPEAQRESIAAAILALPDFAVGGTLLLRDLKDLPGMIRGTEQAATRAENQIDGTDQFISRIERKHGGAVPAGSKDAKKIIANQNRAKDLAHDVQEAHDKSVRLSRKLYLALLGNLPATFVGTPVAESYFNQDNPNFWSRQAKWVGHLLMPPGRSGGSAPRGNFSAKIGACRRVPAGR